MSVRELLPSPFLHFAGRIKQRMAETVLSWQARRWRSRLRDRHGDSTEYDNYLESQLRKTLRQRHGGSDRSERLVGKLSETAPPVAERRRVLCIGCRNARELDLLEHAGYWSVTGIDLFSADRRIQVMDMHRMTFERDTFDVAYSCHSLEHSFDRAAAVSEIVRVVRAGGVAVIEVPIRFKRSATDRQDFESVDGLLDAFQPNVGRVLLAELDAVGDGLSGVARVIFEVRK